MKTLTLFDFTFTLAESPRRKSIGITVERDGSLTLAAPEGTPVEALNAAVRPKQLWLHRKLLEKDRLTRLPTIKQYLSGEGFFYLGRSHRLLIVDDDASAPLRLHQGRFKLRRSEAPRAREHFVRWYKAQAQPRLAAEVSSLKRRLEVEPIDVTVRDLSYRWGSCSPRGALLFHWRIAMLPARIVRYVVLHELAHLREPHHGKAFWSLLERTLPDYEAHREWLASNGAAYDL